MKNNVCMNNVIYYLYADDTQFYISLSTGNLSPGKQFKGLPVGPYFIPSEAKPDNITVSICNFSQHSTSPSPHSMICYWQNLCG